MRFGLVVATFAVLGLAVAGRAAVIPVTTTVDEYGTGVDCSLREAIQAANDDATFGGCPAGSGADQITLPAGTYTLTLGGSGEDANATGDLDVLADLTITGAGAATTIVDGGGLDRVLDVRAGTSVTITDVTLTGGSVAGDGGCLASAISLTLTGVVVSGCSGQNGGGVAIGGGTSTITNTTVSGDTASIAGGGLRVATGAAVTVVASTISGNTAVQGGGIDVQDTLTLRNATVAGNTATGANGGGGILNAGTLTLNNVTLAANTASGADGGGLATSGTATVQNSIVADNVGTTPGSQDCLGTISSAGHNLIEQTGGCTIGGDTTGNVTGSAPVLDALADNGGATQTKMLLVGSPALDAGDPGVPGSGGTTCEADDQRGTARPVGTGCDIGAVEAPSGGGTTTTSTSTSTTSTTETTTTTATTTSSTDTTTSTTVTTTSTTVTSTTSTSTTSTTSTTIPTCQVWPGYDLTGLFNDWWYLRQGEDASLAVDLRPRQRVQNPGFLPLCQVTLCLGYSIPGPTGKMHLEIYSDKTSGCAAGEAACPDQKVGGDSDSYDVSALTTPANGGANCGDGPAAGRFVTFAWSANSPAPTGDFWLVLTGDAGPDSLQGEIEFASFSDSTQHPVGCTGPLCTDYSDWTNDGRISQPPTVAIDRGEDMMAQFMYDPTATTTTSVTSTTSTTESTTSTVATTTSTTETTTTTSTTESTTTSTYTTTSTSSTSSTSTTSSSTSTTSTTSTTLPPVCLGGTTISKAVIIIGKVGAPSGDERLAFSGVLDFTPGTPATFDPAASGAQLLIEDLAGGSASGAFDLTHLTTPVPPGAPGSGCTRKDGWKKGSYKNASGALDPPTCPPGSANGLKSVKLVDRRAKGKGIGFVVKARRSTIPPVTGPLRGTIVLGASAGDSTSGSCGVVTFAGGNCRRKGTTLTCR